MASILRQRVTWTGFPGSPGLSTFYFNDAPAAADALHTFLTGMATALPEDVTLTMQPGGDVIDDTNGLLTGVWAGTQRPPMHGLVGGGIYSAPVGYLVRWETAAIRAGSRLRGRTYFVPALGRVFSADGTIDNLTIVDLQNATAAFVGSVTPNMLVWQRPRLARAAYTDGRGIPHKAVPARQGSSAPVISSSIPDKAVVLRTRRD